MPCLHKEQRICVVPHSDRGALQPLSGIRLQDEIDLHLLACVDIGRSFKKANLRALVAARQPNPAGAVNRHRAAPLSKRGLHHF